MVLAERPDGRSRSASEIRSAGRRSPAMRGSLPSPRASRNDAVSIPGMNERGSRRLSLAISEGDGISVLVEVASTRGCRRRRGAGRRRRRRAESGGASVRDATELPILWCPDGPEAADAAGADACLLVADALRRGLAAARGRPRSAVSSSGSTASSRCTTRRSCRRRSSTSTRRSSCSAESRPTRTRPAIDHVLELLPDVPAGKLAVAVPPGRDARRGRGARARRRGRGRRERERRARARRCRASRSLSRSPAGAARRRSSGSSCVGAAALRLVGVRYGLPDGGLLNPDEQLVVPRAWGITHGARPRPEPVLRLAQPAALRAGAVPGVAGRALVPHRAHRRRRDRARGRGVGVVARRAFVRRPRGRRGRGRDRGRGRARRVLADGGDRRAADDARHGRSRSAGHAPVRAGRAGDRRRDRREVAGRARARPARRRGLGAVAAPCVRRGPRARRVRRREPVRRRPSGRGGLGPVARPFARPGRLARRRRRLVRGRRVRGRPVGRARPGARRRADRPRRGDRAPRPRRSRARDVRRGLLRRAAPARLALRPVRAAARPGARRAGRPVPVVRARDAPAPRRAVRLDGARHAGTDRGRHGGGAGDARRSSGYRPGGESRARARVPALRGVRLGRGAARGGDRLEPRARAVLRQLALRLGRADRRRADGPRDRLLARRRRSPTACRRSACCSRRWRSARCSCSRSPTRTTGSCSSSSTGIPARA